MSPQNRPLARSPFYSRPLLITLLFSAVIAIAMFVAVSASGTRKSGKPVARTGGVTPLIVCSPPATVYVDDTWIGTTPGTDPDGGGPATNFGCDSFATIQNGINGVATSGQVIVRAGTYAESVLINKPLMLLGAKSAQSVNPRFAAFTSGVDGVKADPAVESVITAAATNPTSNTNNTIHVNADNITIDGFVVDGNNPGLPQGGAVVVDGINTDSRRAIETEDAAGTFFAANNVSIKNNIIQNFAQRGIELVNGLNSGSAPATTGSVITGNLIRNFKTTGIVLAFNSYSDVTANTIIAPDDADAAIMVQDYTNNSVTPRAINISNNTITVGQNSIGIWANLMHAPGAAVTAVNISNNTVNAAATVTGASDFTFGIYLTSLQEGTTAQLSGNIIGASGGQFARGIALWNLPTTTATALTGGTVGNAITGVSLHDNDPNFGLAGANSAVNTSGVSISGVTVGVLVDATGSTGDTVAMQVFGNTSVNNSTTAISVTGVNASANIHDNTLAVNATGLSFANGASGVAHFNRIISSTTAIANPNNLTLNLENNWWGCNAGPGNSGCGAVSGTGADFNPWIVLGTSASPNPILAFASSTLTADMTHNSDTVAPLGTIPNMPVTFSATQGSMTPPAGTITTGQATSMFTSTSTSNGTACATVDNQLSCANITVQQTTVTIAPATSPTAVDNDYTRVNNAIQSSFSGQTIKLNGTFNWTEANAAASWALGSDGLASTADDFEILVPANLNNVTLTANSLGDATIQGPGDLAGVNLEGVLVFDGGDNQNWTISNLRFLDFDLSIGMFAGAGGTDAFNNTHITNNYIRIARDLNATVAPADVNQNIGIHFSFGTNEVISGNTIEIQGDAVSNGSNFATDVGMQSNTSGGNVYDGLQITNNIIRVLNAQDATNPQVILGIWENAHAHTSNITISGNQFINQAAGNNPAVNLQRGFRVTSHSSATTTVTYSNNSVTGANIAFQWLAGSNFAGNQPVKLTSNTITNGATGVLVQSQGLANLSFNRIVGNSVAGANNVDGTVTAENNWWGCNAGPGNTGCDGVIGVIDFNPWLVLGISASPGTVVPGGTSTVRADLTHNSDNVTPSVSIFVPPTGVSFGATQGTMTPPASTLSSGQATSTFTSTSTTSGSASATIDNQTVSTNITVAAPPAFTIDDVTHSEGDSGTTAYTFTVTKTGSTALNATVDYATVNGTATAPSDFTAIATTTLTFLPADTTKQFTVLVNGDTIVEPNEAFSVHLSNAVNATISDADGTGTITNDDTDVSIAVSPSSVNEDGAPTLVYTFTRNGITSTSLTVNFSVGGTAAFTTDYTQTGAATFTASSGTVAFGAGNSTTSVTVDPSADTTSEADETVILTVNSGAGYNVASPNSATGTITNDDTDVAVAVAPSSVAEDGPANLVYTFTRTGVTTAALTVNFSVGGTATLATDYTQTGAATFAAASGSATFGAGNSTVAVTIDPTPDLAFEADETVILTVTSGTGYNVGSPSAATGTITNDDAVGGVVRFSAASYNTTESSGSATITVERVGDTTQAVTVDYATPDDSAATTATLCSTISGLASPRCDFTTALGTLRFAAGENSKTFTVLISQDHYLEGPETLQLTLSNLTGGAVFGVPSTATLTIADDATEPTANPIDDASNFVRQQYHDFLNREPDANGLAFWTAEITSCGSNAQCIQNKRINVSSAFFLSIEFQNTGYLVERLYKTSYGDAMGTSTTGGAHQLSVPIVRFSEFLPDTQTIGQGVVVGQTGWELALENNKQSFVGEFIRRSRFTSAYANTLTPAQFVDLLFANSGITSSGVAPTSTERQAAIDEFGGAGTSADLAARGRALRRVAENNTLIQQEFNRAFVLMEYFGYLRRNPNSAPDSDHSGYDFWLTKLNQFTQPGDVTLIRVQKAEIVKAFINSAEYRNRFGTP